MNKMKRLKWNNSIITYKRIYTIKSDGIYVIGGIHYFFSNLEFIKLKSMEDLLLCIDLINSNPKMKSILR